MIIITLFQWCLLAVVPAAACWLAIAVALSLYPRFRDARLLRRSLVICATALVGTFVCGGIVILDAACELRGGYGLLQDLALVTITLAACVPVGFFARGLARALHSWLQ